MSSLRPAVLDPAVIGLLYLFLVSGDTFLRKLEGTGSASVQNKTGAAGRRSRSSRRFVYCTRNGKAQCGQKPNHIPKPLITPIGTKNRLARRMPHAFSFPQV